MPKEQSESPFKDMYIPKNMQHNTGVVNFMYVLLSRKDFMSVYCQTLYESRRTCRGVFGALVAGLIAGIWGVTGWGGFLYYLAMQAVVTFHPTAQHAHRLYQCSSALEEPQNTEVYPPKSTLTNVICFHPGCCAGCCCWPCR